MKNSLMWFRYDLRIKDNEALFRASNNNFCLPIYILDEEYVKLETTSDFHLDFLNESLADLNNNLKKEFNTKLNFYKGQTIEILNHLINKHKIKKIYSNKIFKGDFFNKLDKKVISIITEKGIEWIQTNQFGIQLDKRVRGKWSFNWHKFVTNPTCKKIEEANFFSDNSQDLIININYKKCQRVERIMHFLV